jgi:hypothetical protein
LFELLQGRLPTGGALLPAARVDGFGASVFGPEAVVATFRRASLPVGTDADVLESPNALMLIDGDVALWADHYDGRLGRLWCLGGPRVTDAVPPRVDVPFDPDLDQVRGGVLFAPSDHPELAPDHRAVLPDAAEHLLRARSDRLVDVGEVRVPPATFRRRAFVLRAFSVGERGAMLCGMTTWHDAVERRIETVHAVTAFRGSAGRLTHCRHVVDGAAPARRWAPRV